MDIKKGCCPYFCLVPIARNSVQAWGVPNSIMELRVYTGFRCESWARKCQTQSPQTWRGGAQRNAEQISMLSSVMAVHRRATSSLAQYDCKQKKLTFNFSSAILKYPLCGDHHKWQQPLQLPLAVCECFSTMPYWASAPWLISGQEIIHPHFH